MASKVALAELLWVAVQPLSEVPQSTIPAIGSSFWGTGAEMAPVPLRGQE